MSVISSYHPAFLKDLQDNFEEYMSWEEILNDYAYESKVEI